MVVSRVDVQAVDWVDKGDRRGEDVPVCGRLRMMGGDG